MGIAKRAWLVVVAAIWLLTACVGNGEKRIRESVEGTFEILWDFGMGLSADVHLIQPLQAAYPDATFHYTNIWRITYPSDGVHVGFFHQFDVVGNDAPGDLIVFEHTLAPYYFESGYLEPLHEYVSADLTIHERLDPALLERVRQQGNGEIYALPFGKNVYALYYNKDLFDELQITYPTDGMTWDEVFALAWRIKDHPYYGNRPAIGLTDIDLVLSQLDGRFMEPDTGLPEFRDPVWERIWAFLSEFDQVGTKDHDAYTDFTEGNLAMAVGRLFGTTHNSGVGHTPVHMFNAPYAEWDMVSYPVFPEATDTGPAPAYYYVGIPKNSTRKHDAYRMISSLLSDEAQLTLSRNGLASVRSEPEIEAQYGELTLRPLGKHTPALFYHRREGTLDPVYDLHMQYARLLVGYSYFARDDRLDDFHTRVREEMLRHEEYREMWLEKTKLE